MNNNRGGSYVKKIIYRFKYLWHYTQWKQTIVLVNECINIGVKTELETKASYHERTAISYMMKM